MILFANKILHLKYLKETPPQNDVLDLGYEALIYCCDTGDMKGTCAELGYENTLQDIVLQLVSTRGVA